MSTETPIFLTGEEAHELFVAGKDAWNEYFNAHPNANIDFSSFDFSVLRTGNKILCFSGYLFPKRGRIDFGSAFFGEGGVDFSGVQFGEGDVDFSCARFGEGDVNFRGAQFGKGSVSFDYIQFGKGGIDFSFANFGDGDVHFKKTRFSVGSINFHKASFYEGNIDFSEVQFSSGDVNFSHTKFGKGNIDFIDVQFGEGDIDFRGTLFSEGDVFFKRAQFDEGEVNFSEAQFGKGHIDFSDAHFGKGYLNFYKALFDRSVVNFSRNEFKGHVSFNNLTTPVSIASFSLRHCTFQKTLDISDNHFHCVPDLTNTKLTNQLSLDRMTCQPTVNENDEFDPKDVERLCRLKELAENNKNHHQALEFHAQEMRVKRQEHSILARWLDVGFDCVSEYGQSIARPCAYLVGSIILFAFLYTLISFNIVKPTTFNEELNVLGNGFLYSLSQIFPFLSSGKISATESAQALFYCDDIDNWIYAMGLSQGFLSFVLLFLIGLGLRHRFRL